MTIEVTEVKTNAVAIQVLEYFRAYVDLNHREVKDREGYMTIEYYLNGRERGFTARPELFHTSPLNRKVAFAENRNSSEIVVYFGRVEDFSGENNMPTRDVYLKARYFPGAYPMAAAEYIYNYLMKGLT